MKKSNYILTIFVFLLILFLSSCGSNPTVSTTVNDNNNSTTTIDDNNCTTTVNDDDIITTVEDNNEVTTTLNNLQATIISYKNAALSKLNEIINPVISSIQDEELKTAIQNFYNTEVQHINDIVDLETAQLAEDKVVENINIFVFNTLKPLAVERLNSIINPLINNINDDGLKTSVQSFYNNEMDLIDEIETIGDVVDTFKEIVDDTKEYIISETERILVSLKNRAIEELDSYVVSLINRIPFDELRSDVQSQYNIEKEKLEAVTTLDGFEPCVIEIKDDLLEFVLRESKELAINKIEVLVDAGLEKIYNQEIKDDLLEFADEEFDKINSIDDIDDVVPTFTQVFNETKEHVGTLVAGIIQEYLARLTEVESVNAYDYIPAAMKPTYVSNLVEDEDIAYDFTSFTSISNLNHAGFGEQWQMVIENIDQTVKMAKVYNSVQTALNTAANALDIFIKNSPQEELTYRYESENFYVDFEFVDTKFSLIINYSANINVPILGSVRPIIIMEYDLAKNEKGFFIQLGDAFKTKYVILDNKYEMALTYGVTVSNVSGSRTSYLLIEKDENNKTTGHIYEYTTLNNSDLLSACADFYVEDGYVSVVGNKASGIKAFKGYINELYKENEGRLLGYEVREELTIAGITGTYNTLWFNIWDISGIRNVKILEKSKDNDSSRSTVDVYLNDSETLLSPTYNKILVKTSRKYDIELRKRFYYSYDQESSEYICHEIDFPMMMIQEGDNFNSFEADIKKDNNIDASVALNQEVLNKILSDYDTLIDIFIQNKDLISSQTIIQYLNQYEE